ncbi:hypothetical protein D3C72_1823060 [compost metagenome]
MALAVAGAVGLGPGRRGDGGLKGGVFLDLGHLHRQALTVLQGRRLGRRVLGESGRGEGGRQKGGEDERSHGGSGRS